MQPCSVGFAHEPIGMKNPSTFYLLILPDFADKAQPTVPAKPCT